MAWGTLFENGTSSARAKNHTLAGGGGQEKSCQSRVLGSSGGKEGCDARKRSGKNSGSEGGRTVNKEKSHSSCHRRGGKRREFLKGD